MTVEQEEDVVVVQERPIKQERRSDDISSYTIIDCDIHPLVPDGFRSVFPYMTKAWVERFKGRDLSANPLIAVRYPHPGAVLRAESAPPSGGAPGSDCDFTIEDHLNRYPIKHGLLLPIQGAAVSAWSDGLEAAALASAFNDYFVSEWLVKDKRFLLGMVVAPHDPVQAAEEVRRIGQVDRVGGVWIPLLNILMGNRHYYPIYEAAVELGLPIVIHATAAEGIYQGAPTYFGGVASTYTERYVCLTPNLAMVNAFSLIWEGVFERWPSLRVAFVECGWSWLPGMLWRADAAWRGLRIDTPWVKHPPSDYVREHVRFSTEPFDEPPKEEYVEQIVEMGLADRVLMFASDYPHWDSDDPTLVLRKLPERYRQRVFYDNAAEFFGGRL
jgi:predicted TIM-barrel fold metal-dependent hydrolase